MRLWLRVKFFGFVTKITNESNDVIFAFSRLIFYMFCQSCVDAELLSKDSRSCKYVDDLGALKVRKHASACTPQMLKHLVMWQKEVSF